LIVESAARWGVDPYETLATHIFENGQADPGASSSVGALGLAQIFDKYVGKTTNPKGWNQFASSWGFKGSKAPLSDFLKRDPRFAIDYLAWRMAGSRERYNDLDAWYRSGGYNPNFTGDDRGPGPSIYMAGTSTSMGGGTRGPVFPVTGSEWSFTEQGGEWGADRDGGSRLHRGVDIAAPRGTPVVAVASGTVSRSIGGAGGKEIWINGKYYYAHLDTFNVKEGQKVKKGQVIGTVGSTGTSSSGPHLHFGIDPKGGRSAGESWIDPSEFLGKASHGGSVPPGPYGDPDATSPPGDHDFMFGDFTERPGAALPINFGPPAVGPVMPGASQGLQYQRRDTQSQSWRLILGQDDVSPETMSLGQNFTDSEPL